MKYKLKYEKKVVSVKLINIDRVSNRMNMSILNIGTLLHKLVVGVIRLQ
jgi:hypothetical protein